MLTHICTCTIRTATESMFLLLIIDIFGLQLATENVEIFSKQKPGISIESKNLVTKIIN